MTQRRVGRLALDGIVGLVLAALFLPMAFLRLVDANEGIELVATRLVMEGHVPYHDFHYPHMPLLPYLYALGMTLTGLSWYSARILSVLLAIALGIVLVRHVERVTGSRRSALLATALLGLSGLAFVWYPLVLAHAVATLLVFMTFALIESGSGRWTYVGSGLCLGLAVDARLYLVALLPVFAVAALRKENGRRNAGEFLAGTALGLLPNLFFIARGPDVWLFNVLGHHVLRGSAWHGDVAERLRGLLNLLGIAGSFGAASLQFTLLFLVWLGAVVSALLLRERLLRSTPIVVVLTLVSLLPTSTYSGYFHTILPFLVADVVVLVARIGEAVSGPSGELVRRRLAHALVIVAGLYVLVAPVDIYSFTVGGDVPGTYPPPIARHWRISAINRVGRAVDLEMPPSETTAISWWPGYFVESRTRIFPRLENPFALWHAARLTPERISRYHFIGHPELAAHIEAHTAPVIVLGRWMAEVRAVYGTLMAHSGYVRVTTLEDMEIYRWNGHP